MAPTPLSLAVASELIRELRQAVREVQAVKPPLQQEADIITPNSSIEAISNNSVRTIARCRDALLEARREAEQYGGDPADGAAFVEKVAQAERDLDHVRVELRRATVDRKRRDERRSDAESHALLVGRDAAPGMRRRRADMTGQGDETGSVAGQAREMKQSLQRTRKMMAEQLARVAQVSEMMGEQDDLLKNTYSEHQGIGGSLRRAGTTLTRLKAVDIVDSVVMGASTLVFFATVCFVLYQRLPMLGLL